MNVEAYLAERRALVDAALERALRPGEGTPPRLLEAMRYAVLSGGKRVRPILALAACEAVPADGRRALPFGCAIELIHAYSLVHDDLPAMDDDTLRRGRPTVHVRYGEALAILVGDALLTEAFRVAAEGARTAGVGAEHVLTMVARIAAAAGAAGMVGGQVADLEAEGGRPDHATVEAIHRRKTAALISAAIDVGALAGGADGACREALAEYGRALGLAFQIADDILDATAPTAVTGKREGGDVEHGKATYPAVLGIDGARAAARELLGRCLAATETLGESADPLRAMARFVVERAS
ncbi:MAG: polyprenyl synthetase family protein [Deltaproteobacteria bacterium]|nr:polyprenyl synthetase family protein [Deltaproteobacteria bacterium]